MRQAQIFKLVDYIQKLKMITETIRSLNEATDLNILENYQRLLEVYWLNCVTTSFDAGPDIPFEDSIFWLRTEGDISYTRARNRILFYIVHWKLIYLSKSQIYLSFYQVTFRILHFDQTTHANVLEIHAELLEQNWVRFLDAYLEIVKGMDVAAQHTKVFSETETYYINAKTKIRNLILSTALKTVQPFVHIPDNAYINAGTVGPGVSNQTPNLFNLNGNFNNNTVQSLPNNYPNLVNSDQTHFPNGMSEPRREPAVDNPNPHLVNSKSSHSRRGIYKTTNNHDNSGYSTRNHSEPLHNVNSNDDLIVESISSSFNLIDFDGTPDLLVNESSAQSDVNPLITSNSSLIDSNIIDLLTDTCVQSEIQSDPNQSITSSPSIIVSNVTSEHVAETCVQSEIQPGVNQSITPSASISDSNVTPEYETETRDQPEIQADINQSISSSPSIIDSNVASEPVTETCVQSEVQHDVNQSITSSPSITGSNVTSEHVTKTWDQPGIQPDVIRSTTTNSNLLDPNKTPDLESDTHLEPETLTNSDSVESMLVDGKSKLDGSYEDSITICVENVDEPSPVVRNKSFLSSVKKSFVSTFSSKGRKVKVAKKQD